MIEDVVNLKLELSRSIGCRVRSQRYWLAHTNMLVFMHYCMTCMHYGMNSYFWRRIKAVGIPFHQFRNSKWSKPFASQLFGRLRLRYCILEHISRNTHTFPNLIWADQSSSRHTRRVKPSKCQKRIKYMNSFESKILDTPNCRVNGWNHIEWPSWIPSKIYFKTCGLQFLVLCGVVRNCS